MTANFQPMHDELFSAFAIAALVQRAGGGAVPVQVIYDEGQIQLGEFGQAVGQVNVATFLLSQYVPAVGDIVTIGATARAIESIRLNDGFVAEAVLYG